MKTALAVLVALLVALGVGWWQGGQSAREDNADALAAVNGARLADARIWARDSQVIAERARVAEERYARIAAQRLDAQLVAARTQLHDAQAVLADSNASAYTLRNTLTETVHRLNLVTDFAESYRVRMDSLEAAHARERAALMSGLTYADSIGAHWKQEAERIAKASRCRVLFVPCPSRTVSGLIGGGVVAVVAMRAR